LFADIVEEAPVPAEFVVYEVDFVGGLLVVGMGCGMCYVLGL